MGAPDVLPLHGTLRRPAIAPAGRWLLAGLVVAVLLAVRPGAAFGAAVGTAVITQPEQSTPLDAGGSRTPYGVALPSGASCPGDTAHDGYLVDSYLVPQGASPTQVSYRGGVPRKWFGYISGGAYYGAINTAYGTGELQQLPLSFTWTRLTPHDLFPDGQHRAVWEGGIACVNSHGNVTNYWNTQIVFTADPADPGGFTWRVHQPPAPSNGALMAAGIASLGVALVAAAAALVLVRRARRHAAATTPAPWSRPERRPPPVQQCQPAARP